MNINIKLKTMLEGEKGCLSKDEIVKSLREIKYQVLFENDNVSLDTKVLDLMIDRVANVYLQTAFQSSITMISTGLSLDLWVQLAICQTLLKN